MTLLPPIYESNDKMKELQYILSNKVNDISASFNETINQCFINTATVLLSRYEKIYGLTVDATKTDAFRRERIIARARGTGTVTKKMIQDVASSYSNGEVEVIEDPASYRFKVKFVGTKGIPANMADLTVTIEEIKPAHMSFTFEYTYITWDQFETYHKTFNEWEGLNLTWEAFEKYDG
jgi:uncharacterized protein YmfQ (DUF2313 family)